MAQAGKIAFIVGLLIALVGGLGLYDAPWFTWVLALLGLVVGFLNVSGEERRGFLIAAIALTLSAQSVSSLPVIGDKVTAVLGNVVAFIAAAVLIVALRSLFDKVRE